MSNDEQEIKGEINDGLRISDKIVFRDSKSLDSEMMQIIILVVTLVLACFIIYIVIVMLAIFIYHIFFDNDVQNIPKFVKNSPQFRTRIEAIERKILEKQINRDYLKKNQDRFDPETGELIPKHKPRKVKKET